MRFTTRVQTPVRGRDLADLLLALDREYDSKTIKVYEALNDGIVIDIDTERSDG